MMKIEDKRNTKGLDRKMTRKEAIKKAGYAAFSAATMLFLLNDPARGQGDTQSRAEAPPDFDEWDGW